MGMKRPVQIIVGLVVLAVVGLVGWRVFEHFDQQDKIKNATKDCTTFDVTKPGAAVPEGFSLPEGQKLLEVQSVGKTAVVRASLPGSRGDLVAVRDRVATELKAQGYTLTSTDQEPTFEADGVVTKAGVADSINVRPLCAGRVVVRYTLHR